MGRNVYTNMHVCPPGVVVTIRFANIIRETKSFPESAQFSLSDNFASVSIHDRLSNWESMLESDFDKEFLLDGVKNGFRIIDDGAELEDVFCENYKSATTEFAEKTEQQIATEMHGHYTLRKNKA